jgi:hypothetical protein
MDNYSRPATYTPIPTYTQKGVYAAGQPRAFTPIQPSLPLLQMGSFNSSNIKIKFNYQGNASNCSPGFIKPFYQKMMPSVYATMAPARTNQLTGPSS